jgi:uncharacterized repeat protein (TIGR02543 family)
MIDKKFSTARRNSTLYQKGGVTRKLTAIALFLLLVAAFLPLKAHAATPTYPIFPDVQTTRDRVVSPLSITDTATPLVIQDVSQYAEREYSSWQWGPGVVAGPFLPDGTTTITPTAAATLLNFFTVSDIHITDKESPGQALYGAVGLGSFGSVNTSAYSPVILSTTHVLDAAVQTINALHDAKPFDFGMSLGDDANNNQYNELRWFIDVMDGKWIVPSTGAHQGATGAHSIDYQRPYQSAGLNKDIPWYQTIGNHDQYWNGSLVVNDYARSIAVGRNVINMGVVGENQYPSLDVRGTYQGVIDGTTEYGVPIKLGDTSITPMPAQTVVPDPTRRTLSTKTSTTLNWMKEFFTTTSKPKGHGFAKANLDNDFASYSFEPKAGLPLKVISLDDTCKENPYPPSETNAYARGCLDQQRYDWLINELEQGQAEGKLMIITAHVPVGPWLNVPDAVPTPNPAPPPTNIPYSTPVAVFMSTCDSGLTPIGSPCSGGIGIDHNLPVPPYSVVTDASLLAALHNYPNLILWLSGHRHMNTISPQPAPPGMGAEFGFFEVETASLRDHPQQFRTFELIRNTNNTLTIRVTDVDPSVQDDPTQPPGSPAAKSRGYSIGAGRISEGYPGFTDTGSHAYNADLVKPLPTPYTMTVVVTGTGTVNFGPYYPGTCTAAAPCAPVAYLPGTQVTLTAIPSAGYAFAGWSTCGSGTTCNMTMTGNVTVTATFTKAPTLAVTPAYKSFGTVSRGKRSGAVFKVTNTRAKGVADLTIGTITKTGSDAGQFQVLADRCSGATLKTGKSCTFRVSFVPTLTDTRTATVNIPSNDPNQPMVIPITGIGK